MNVPSRRVAMIVGPLPPPVHGFAVITAAMRDALARLYDCRVIDLSPHRARGGAIYHLTRLALALRGVPVVLRARRALLYLACEGGLGLVYTLILTVAGRIARLPIFIHHHSFAYIDREKVLMRWLVRLAGQRATHIFLGPAMQAGFTARYGSDIRCVLLPNSAFVPAVPPETSAPRPLTIGLLSNLNTEKGLDDFIALARAAVAEGMDIRAVLAGPAQRPRDRALIEAAARDLGPRFDYRGKIYDADKDRFFRDIDVFIFPTRYVNEAQPTVLYEAQAHGIPGLAFDRGCIADQVGASGATLPRDGDFTNFALNHLRRWLGDPATLAALRLDVRDGFVKQSAEAARRIAGIFEDETAHAGP